MSRQIPTKFLSRQIFGSLSCPHGRPPLSRSPLNEDVFLSPAGSDVRSMSPDVAQLSEQIHRVLVHPVHCGSSQGYGSLGSGTEQHASTGSSSESTGPVQELRRQPLRPVGVTHTHTQIQYLHTLLIKLSKILSACGSALLPIFSLSVHTETYTSVHKTCNMYSTHA